MANRSQVVNGILLTVNILLFPFTQIFLPFFLAETFNGLLLPDAWWSGICHSFFCDAVTRSVIWGGAALEGVVLAYVFFFSNRAILRSYLMEPKWPFWLFLGGAVLSVGLFSAIGVMTI